jgi:hypothetical protein
MLRIGVLEMYSDSRDAIIFWKYKDAEEVRAQL